MSDKKRVARNLLWNCTGVGADTLAGFVMAPFLIHRLGESTYGVWIVLGSLTSYFGLLDLGVRGSVGRYLAFHRARGDQRGVNETLSTALAILGGVGLLAFLGTLAVLPFFCGLFGVPEEQAGPAQLALGLVGLNLGLSLLLNAFDATLWGFQRFDLLNAIDVPTTLLRVGLTFYFVSTGGGLVALALITVLLTLANGAVKAAFAFVENRSLWLSPALVKRTAVKAIFGYSVWSFLVSIERIARTQVSPLLVGILLSVASVTPFAIANRLMAYVGAVLSATTGVFTPHATALHARKDHERQRQLFLDGGKYCFAFALFLLTLLLCLGKSLLLLWIGPALAGSYPLLVILAVGDLLPNSQYVTNGMLYAAARHRALAYLGMVELVLIVLLTVLLGGPFGLPGVAVALAVPGVFGRGIAQVFLGCRLTGVSPWRYAARAFLPPLACAALPAGGLAAVVAWRPPETWPELVLYTAAFAMAYAGACVFLIGVGPLRALVAGLLTKAAPAPVPVTAE